MILMMLVHQTSTMIVMCVMVTTHLVQIVLEYLMVQPMKMSVVIVMMIAQMTVYKIVLVYGVVI